MNKKSKDGRKQYIYKAILHPPIQPRFVTFQEREKERKNGKNINKCINKINTKKTQMKNYQTRATKHVCLKRKTGVQAVNSMRTAIFVHIIISDCNFWGD